MKHFLIFLLLLGLTGFFSRDVSGQLLYTTLDNSNQPILRQTNLDGTGNTVFNINGLATASEAQYSNDGRLLGFTGRTVAQANQFGTNVFTFDPATNQTRQITNFADFFDPSSGNRLFTEPIFKSFSPDGTRLAIVLHTLFIPPPDPFNPNPPQSVAGRTLTFFSTGGQQLGPEIVDFNFIGSSTSGAGVSWSPVDDLIAIPVTTPSQNPLVSGPTPIAGFNSSGQFVGNLTSPTASGLGTQFVEHDMYPSFSPNGVALAYFRSTRIGFGSTASLLDLRISSPAGDRSILSFTPGQLPLGLSWSPNGGQLSFSVGEQPLVLGIRGFEPNATTASIGIVNVDGTAATPFLTAPAGFPEYFPGTAVRLGDVNMDGAVSFLDISPFISILSTGDFQAEADINQSGEVDFLDISAFIAILSSQ